MDFGKRSSVFVELIWCLFLNSKKVLQSFGF